jgi:hypothetical protein
MMQPTGNVPQLLERQTAAPICALGWHLISSLFGSPQG